MRVDKNFIASSPVDIVEACNIGKIRELRQSANYSEEQLVRYCCW